MDPHPATRAELLRAIRLLYRLLKTTPKDQRPALIAQIRALADRYWPKPRSVDDDD